MDMTLTSFGDRQLTQGVVFAVETMEYEHGNATFGTEKGSCDAARLVFNFVQLRLKYDCAPLCMFWWNPDEGTTCTCVHCIHPPPHTHTLTPPLLLLLLLLH
jgi:hypothetical protein